MITAIIIKQWCDHTVANLIAYGIIKQIFG